MKPGIYRRIPNDDYHSGPGDSKSGLDLVRKSPAAFRAVKTGLRKRVPTASQATGTSIHAMVLEPELVARTYAPPFAASEGALTTADSIKAALSELDIAFKQAMKKGDLESLVREHMPDVPLVTDERAAYDAANEGKIIIEPEEWARLENMLAAIRAHKTAMKLLSSPGEAELSAYWLEPVTDPETGQPVMNPDGTPAMRLLRVRPDYWTHKGILIDLKSTSPGGASLEQFSRSIDKWRYHVQHAMYLRGARKALKAAELEDATAFQEFRSPREFVFIAVETDACVVDGVSMGVAVYRLDPEDVLLGIREMTEDIATLHACDSSKRWPGYPERIQSIRLPAYAHTRAEERAAYGA